MISEMIGSTYMSAMVVPGFSKLSSLEQEDIISRMVIMQLEKLAPQLGAKLLEIAEPAAQRAVAVIKPAMEEKLKEYIPMFALITGALLGGAILLGTFISRPRR